MTQRSGTSPQITKPRIAPQSSAEYRYDVTTEASPKRSASIMRKWAAPLRLPLTSNSTQPAGCTATQPSQGAAGSAITTRNKLEQKSIEIEPSVLEICLVTRSRNAFDIAAASAISEAIPMVAGSGRRMNITPTKPIPITSQRTRLTRSRRKMGASAATNIGLPKTIATIWANGSNDNPVTVSSVVEKKRTARRSCAGIRFGNSALYPP